MPAMRSVDPRHTWSVGFARTVAEELRQGVASGALTWSEADELEHELTGTDEH